MTGYMARYTIGMDLSGDFESRADIFESGAGGWTKIMVLSGKVAEAIGELDARCNGYQADNERLRNALDKANGHIEDLRRSYKAIKEPLGKSVDRLTEARNRLNGWREHACAGWDCAVCSPSELEQELSEIQTDLDIGGRR